MQVFADRAHAGRALAAALDGHPALQHGRLVVLAIPRGGLPVGAEVARALGAELDVAVARKLRSPNNPELAFGAVGADGHVDVDEAYVQRLGLSPDQVEAEIAARKDAVSRRLALYRDVVPAVNLDGAVVIVVDDGVATGSTASQACQLARRGGARRVMLATPVAPRGAEEELGAVADDVVVLSSPAEFIAVGQAYHDFDQLDDEAALTLLRQVVAPAD